MHRIPYTCPGCGREGVTATECENAVALHPVCACGATVRVEVRAVGGVELGDAVLAMRATGAKWGAVAAHFGITRQRAVGIGVRAANAGG